MYKNHSEKVQKIISGILDLKEHTKDLLSSIEKNSDLNAFNSISKDVVEKAASVAEKIKSGKHGKLAGMTVAVKDVISVKNEPLTCSSEILKNFKPLYDATVVEKLLEEDAIIIGKTNCDEFAMGSSNENSAFGPVLNPVNKNRVPGGSSGGSAVAVAAGLCDASLGTDTGGSIRQPAAFVGIYGLKPTYGLVSRFGLTAYASSFDSIGPFANNLDDLSAILEVISGEDKKDSTSSGKKFTRESLENLDASKLKIGYPKEFFGKGIQSEVKENFLKVIQKLKSAGIEISEVSLPHNEYSIAAYYILTTAEASSNLARYDGVRYGVRDLNSTELKEMYEQTRSIGFGKEVKRRIMLGTYVLSSGYYDAYYKKAQKVRRLIKNDFDNVFDNFDLILSPTTPTTAFKLGEKTNDPLQMYLADVYTTSANLAGIPGLNIPIGFDNDNLPIGMQLMSNQFCEDKIISFAKILENEMNLS
ncbi:MAG: Asp-tRNA(Asn)/Glu-tRNA(Gln) amidotransferase subunit GatA [Melioribacteraceae bacterium]|nr:Asp-tRNA(Asn)/Glu-tRNA(Gln) amidotransferase subunit GatA [Melioribacteraceae bacterium]